MTQSTRTAPRLLAALPLAALPLIGALSCVPAEEGVDRTVISGKLEISAKQVNEPEPTPGCNDDPAAGALTELGELGYANLRVFGRSLSFGERPNGTPSGDADWYLLRPSQDGDTELRLLYDSGGSGDTGGAEAQRYVVTVADRAQPDAEGLPTVLLEATTDGAGGLLSLPLELSRGAELLIGVRAAAGELTEAPYELQISGFDPAQGGFKVGLYPGATAEDRGAPLGGSSVGAFEDEPESRARVAPWTLYGATPVNREGEGEDAVSAVGEKPSTAYLWAGNFADLNAGITAGTMFSTNPIELSLDIERRVGVYVLVDAVQPVVIGWELAETEPNNVEVDDSYSVLSGTPMALPEASGPGFVDVLTGRLDFPEADPEWSGENDSFSFTVPEDMGLVATLRWADEGYNIDMNWNGGDGAILGAGWDVGDVNPERFDSVANYGLVLSPGQTYTLTLLPWSGAAGGVDYTLTLEWTAP